MLHFAAFLESESKSAGISTFASWSRLVARTTTNELLGRWPIASRVAWRSWRVTRWRVTEPPIARGTIKPTFGSVSDGSGRRYPTNALVEERIEDLVTRWKSTRAVSRLGCANKNLYLRARAKRRYERDPWRGEQIERLDHPGLPCEHGSRASLRADGYSAGKCASWGLLLTIVPRPHLSLESRR